MTESNDWPPYQIGSRDHLHAIGVLIAAWNLIETAYQTFIQLIFPHHMKAGIHTYELLGNDERVKLIRAELSEILSEQEKELLEHFLKAANICKEYRNVLAHSSYSDQVPGEQILLSKGASKDRSSLNIFSFSVAGIREMADVTYLTASFGSELWASVQMRISNESWALHGVRPKFWQPFPEKPPLPRRWDQIREAPKPPPSQPQSSQA